MGADAVTRRESLLALAGAAVACTPVGNRTVGGTAMDDAGIQQSGERGVTRAGLEGERGLVESNREASLLRRVAPLGFPFETLNPFLFCVHHDNHYPRETRISVRMRPSRDETWGKTSPSKMAFGCTTVFECPGFPNIPIAASRR
ncbi:MAG: hypothetical protein QM784_33185 [Polyangiaceae bacterium]